MNFFDFDVKDEGGKATLAGQGFALPVPERFDLAGAHRVCLGIRPEGAKIVPSEEKPGVLRATVEVVEPLGAEIHLTLGSDVGPLTVVVGPDKLAAVGDAVGVAFPAEALHLFSMAEGQGHLRRAAAKEA